MRVSALFWAAFFANCWWMPSFVFSEDVANEAAANDASAIEEPEIEDYQREHWSFTPIVRPQVPDVEGTEWAENEIDFFILKQLEKRNLTPAPEASKRVFLRRVKFDLLGLPPTPKELQTFLEDNSAQSYERLVDRLLGSPAYGERWAQHWLDLARFAETDGFEHDKVRAQAWRYRQWVVDSLNQDMPYDEFITLQLAGDLLGKDEHAIATTFCLAGPDMPDINEQDLRRHDKLNEITATVGASLLGLQVGCAQCHDHKYDPISQADFYRLRSIFEPAIPELKRDKPIVSLASQSQPLSGHLYYRGELSGRGPMVDPAPPRIACLTDESVENVDFAADEDPRLAFTKWLFDSGNPLTSRVIANRVWQHHFGKSLCGNPSDFGVVASEPTHPELLDWLATELQYSSWSLKHLHRKIVLSSTYRQAGNETDLTIEQSAALRKNIEEDPDNRRYGRFPRKRLSGEAIRDAMLALSGRLNRQYGGASVRPPLPQELTQTLLRGQWDASTDESDHHRRSIYVFARRNLRYPIFDVFDRPDAGATCAQRNNSTTAIQSLQLLNSQLAISAAEHLRDRLLRETHSDNNEQLISALYEIAYCRLPSEFELQYLVGQLSQPDQTIDESRDNNLLTICMAVINANEFIYID